MRRATEEPEDQSWQDFANCLGVDPDLFFPERGASTKEAKEVCRGCVVREDCLEYALANGEKFGIWGGMSERERRRIRRQRALARAQSQPWPCRSPPAPDRPHAEPRPAAPVRQRPDDDRRDPRLASRASMVRSGSRSSCAQRRGSVRLDHRGRHQADQLGPRHLGRRADRVVDLGRSDLVGGDEVHRDLHLVAHLEAEGAHRRAPEVASEAASPFEVGLGAATGCRR